MCILHDMSTDVSRQNQMEFVVTKSGGDQRTDLAHISHIWTQGRSITDTANYTHLYELTMHICNIHTSLLTSYLFIKLLPSNCKDF